MEDANPIDNDMSESYEGLPALSWDAFGGNEPELDFELLKKKMLALKGRCLDLTCGSGKFLVPFARNGIRIDGVDSSETMIANCRLRLEQEKLSAELYCQKAQELDLPSRYEAIFISVGSFAMFTSIEDAMEVLVHCRSHLVKNGELYVTLFQPDEARDCNHESSIKLGPKSVINLGEVTIERWTESVDYFEQIVVQKRRYTLRKEGEKIKEENFLSSMRWFGINEFTLMLKASGFKNIDTMALDGSPAKNWDEMVVFKGVRE